MFYYTLTENYKIEEQTELKFYSHFSWVNTQFGQSGIERNADGI